MKRLLFTISILLIVNTAGGQDSLQALKDKGFSQEWIDNLSARGQQEVYTASDLKYIGMPVGGLFCGQVYLGGDGQLWYWEINNLKSINPGGPGDKFYLNPMTQADHQRIEQGFAVRVTSQGKTQTRELNRKGFDKIAFRGEYPVGSVQYRDAYFPVDIDLTAYSPFCPTDSDESGLPVVVMEYEMKNISAHAANVQLGGWLQNCSGYFRGAPHMGQHRNRIQSTPQSLSLVCESVGQESGKSHRADILFENFEGGSYENWTVEGNAFGDIPYPRSEFLGYHNVQGHIDLALVNTHNARISGVNSATADQLTGKLTSKEFKIDRKYINFLISGGSHKGQTELQLMVDGEVVARQQGDNSNMMKLRSIDASQYEGKNAKIVIVDSATGVWGHIGADHIVFSDSTPTGESLDELPDYGTMVLSLLSPGRDAAGTAQVDAPAKDIWTENDLPSQADVPLKEMLVGGVCDRVQLKPGESKTIVFALSWHFPNVHKGYPGLGVLTNIQQQRNYYAGRFSDASEVAVYVSKNYKELSETTKLWRQTWYDSTLPYWFLDRTFLNVSTLATTVWQRFHDPVQPELDGRPYCREGVHLGDGTCTHVLHYEQAMGRVFPDVTRDLRSKVDYGLAFRESDGVVRYRAEYSGQGHHGGSQHAIDGHCGTIMRVYREHLMSKDDRFLRSIWAKVKKSVEVTIAQDAAKTGQANGVLEGRQYNTLDLTWYGKIPWISGLYCAALRAGAAMADDMDDPEFAAECRRIADLGKRNMGRDLFNGEYFVQEIDQEHLDAPNTNVGSHIDQLLGEYWAHQVGLPGVFEESQARKAARSIFRYNFFRDVGVYLKDPPIAPKRFYSQPGEPGCMVCVFPKGGGKSAHGDITGGWHALALGYFSESWTGQEYPAAANMIDHGLVLEGLALVRAVHERYLPSRRNPYNEVEYGNHYTRAMSSYAPFVSMSGFRHHGPKGQLRFAPKLHPENFKSAFIAAEGWGSFTQKQKKNEQQMLIEMKWGQMQVRQLAFELSENKVAESAEVTFDNKSVKVKLAQDNQRLLIDLDKKYLLRAGQSLKVKVLFE